MSAPAGLSQLDPDSVRLKVPNVVSIIVNAASVESDDNVFSAARKSTSGDGLKLIVIENNNELKKISNYLEKFGYKKYYVINDNLKKHRHQDSANIIFK